MPTLTRLCNHPGCGGTALRGSTYCSVHKAASDERRAERVVVSERQRESAARRGYDAKWRRNRAMFLRHHPVCCQCGKPATEADHIQPRARGGSDRWDNLQPLCKPCHSRKTIAEYRSTGGRIGPRGDAQTPGGRGDRISTGSPIGTGEGGQKFTPSGYAQGGSRAQEVAE